jgi:WXG100 family type VII secretion target
MTLKVNIEDLVSSGLSVTTHGEDVASKHADSDNRVEAASSGWQGQSAAAMSAKSATWTQATHAVLTRLGDHAQGLHASAHGFADLESRNSQSLAEPGQAADAIAASGD